MVKPPAVEKRERKLPPERTAAGRRPSRGRDGAATRRRSRERRPASARGQYRVGLEGWMRPRMRARQAPGRGRTGDCRGATGSSNRAWAVRSPRSQSGGCSSRSLRRSCESAGLSPADWPGRCGWRSSQ
ncbi:hypothetical protein G6F66_014471 [Rhizopus arrhizus]|nr:hypothetical protein G6F66_014471 [Rhizopus arrhizus]